MIKIGIRVRTVELSQRHYYCDAVVPELITDSRPNTI